MSREIYVMRGDKLVPKRLASPLPTATGKTVHVISDHMNPIKHMATGRVHDSKSQFRADTRATGCIEAGNDPALSRGTPRVEPSMGDVVNDVKRSLQELNSR